MMMVTNGNVTSYNFLLNTLYCRQLIKKSLTFTLEPLALFVEKICNRRER